MDQIGALAETEIQLSVNRFYGPSPARAPHCATPDRSARRARHRDSRSTAFDHRPTVAPPRHRGGTQVGHAANCHLTRLVTVVMAGSPKAGFPARRPGRLFGKKQMVMFGCIVLVLFVAPSLFGIGDTTDSHGLDPDDRGLVRTDFDGDRKHSRRSSWRADASDDLHAGYRMRSDDDLHAGHHGLGSSSWSSSWSSSSSSSRDRHERERDERHERRARERRRHAGHGGLEHDIARRASELAIPRVEEYVNRKLVDPAARAIERGDRVDPNDPSKGHKHGGVGGFFDAIAHPFGIGASDADSESSDATDPNAYVPAADFGLPHHGKRSHHQKIPAWGEKEPPATEDDVHVRTDGALDQTRTGAFDDDADDTDDARSLRREERIGFHDFVANEHDPSSGSGSKSGSWFGSLFGGSNSKMERKGRRERAGSARSTESKSTRGGRGDDDEDAEDEYGGGGRFDDPAPRKRSSSRGS